jgi:hypothetical protein
MKKWMIKSIVQAFIIIMAIGVFAAVHYSDPTQRGIYNIEHFGAISGDSADDTSAIQATVDKCVADGGGVILTPIGSYHVTTIAKQITTNIGITFRGQHKTESVWTNYNSNSDTMLNITTDATPRIVHLRIENMSFVGANDCNLVSIDEGAHYDIANCYFQGGTPYSVHLQGSIYGTVDKCLFYLGATGLIAEKTTIGTNVLNISNTKFWGCTTVGAYLEGGAAITFISSSFESCGTNGNNSTGGVRIGANIGTDGGYGMVSFDNCWWEANNGYDVNDLGSTHKKTVSCRDCLFLGSDNGYYMDGGSTAPKLIMENCQMPNCNLEFEQTQNIVAVLTGCVFADITGTSGNYIHRLGTDYNSGFYPEYMFNLNTAGNVSANGNVKGATYGSDGSISDVELLTIDDP